MADKPQAGVLASLPSTRPHRRSAKRSPARLAGESVPAPAEPTVTEAKSVDTKPKRPARTAAKARTAKAQTTKATAAKPASKARTAKLQTAKSQTAKSQTAKSQTAKTTAAKPAAKAPAARARSGKPETASQTRRATSQSGTAHHTQPRTQAPGRAGGKPSAPDPATGPLGTAVQAAAELAEIGMMASARALRGALSRLPRP